MTLNKEYKFEAILALCCALCVAFGGGILVRTFAGIGLMLVVGRLWTHWRRSQRKTNRPPVKPSRSTKPGSAKRGSAKPKSAARRKAPRRPQRSGRRRMEPQTPDALVNDMLSQGRYAILLRQEVAANLEPVRRTEAAEILEEEMAEINAGEIRMTVPTRNSVEQGSRDGVVAHVGQVLIDRYAVSNAEYKEFVDDGGYENDEFWSPEVLDSRRQFVDQTGEFGPRFWRNGCHAPGRANHPVVGVSWYEAKAYARWAGKRLPTSPEWVKAASSPTSTATASIQQRKYPWGDTVDDCRANLWSAGIGKTVPVTEFSAGDTCREVRQLAGNVWEWTADDFATWSPLDGWEGDSLTLKSLRGGAFDTYFETQAACHAQSGEQPLARRHNIGFRCVLDHDQLAQFAGSSRT
jgi:iron(II)-dependent oxidoreductase